MSKKGQQICLSLTNVMSVLSPPPHLINIYFMIWIVIKQHVNVFNDTQSVILSLDIEDLTYYA